MPAWNPCTLSPGISEAAPIWNAPLPVPVISRRESAESAVGVNLKGNLRYTLVRAGIVTD